MNVSSDNVILKF